MLQTNDKSIGTLNEGSLHASLKNWYQQPGDKLEVEVSGYVIDLVQDDRLIEIQTANFSQISTKIERLIRLYPLKLVYPIAQFKWLCQDSHRRKSPKRGKWLHLFDELIAIPKLLMEDNFSLEVILVEMEEQRSSSKTHKKGWKVIERRLVKVIEEVVINRPSQLAELTLPKTLPNLFSTADLSNELKIRRRLAQRICYCLRQMGEILPLSKNGNSILYTRKITIG